MTALVLVGLVAVVLIALTWSRVGLARSERRSIKSYGRSLEVLGKVSSNSEARAEVSAVLSEHASRDHIRAEHLLEDEDAGREDARAPIEDEEPAVRLIGPDRSPAARRPATESPADGDPASPVASKPPITARPPAAGLSGPPADAREDTPPVAPGVFGPPPPPAAGERLPPVTGDTTPGDPDVELRSPAAVPSPPKLTGARVRFEDDSDAYERARTRPEIETTIATPVFQFDDAGGGTDGADGAEPTRRLSPEDGPSTSAPGGRSLYRTNNAPAWPKVGSVAAALVAVAGLVVAGFHFAGGGGTTGTTGATSTTSATKSGQHHAGGTNSPSAGSSTSTTTPDSVVPVSTSPTDVAFVAPAGTYTVSFADTTSNCWVGIQQTSGGPYVWQETLGPGQSASYKASGPLVIRIGAPQYLGVKVNGLPARLPGYVQPYDLTFNPATPPSSA